MVLHVGRGQESRECGLKYVTQTSGSPVQILDNNLLTLGNNAPSLLLLFPLWGLCSLFLVNVSILLFLALPPLHLFQGLLLALHLFLPFHKAVLTTSCHCTLPSPNSLVYPAESEGAIVELI